MRARLVILTVALVAVGVLNTWPASAETYNTDGGYTEGNTTADGASVSVIVPGSSGQTHVGGGGGSGGGNANVSCSFFRASGSAGAYLPGVGEQVTDTSTIDEGAVTWLVCRDIGSGEITFENIFPWDSTNPPVLGPSAAVLAQMAVNDIRLPTPGVRTWPPSGGTGLVNLAVWLHVDNWAPLTASASAGGLVATVEATPVRVLWDMDEGSVTCTDAGTVFESSGARVPDSSSCSFTYRRSSGANPDNAFHNSAQIVWHLRWTSTNGEGGDLGEMAGPVTAFDLAIAESQALIVPSNN